MEPSSVDRKLTAILSADVFGYSRLMGADEEATVSTLTAYREVFLTTIPQHNGRVVDAKGDALLAEFPTVTDAVRCAVAIQQELAERNAALPDDRTMAFRIGINLGEVLVRGEEIYGDGVNIAARLEALADPGGICVSGSVYDNIQNRLDVGYEYLGEQSVKNIRQPIRAYQVRLEPEAATPVHRVQRPIPWPWRRLGVGAVLFVLIGMGAVWQAFLRPTPAPVTTVAESPGEIEAQPTPMQDAIALDPHRIAVLPFVNMSAEADNEYFSDGMTEELTSKLSRLRELAVIARTSVMKYKETEKDVAEIGQALQVGTILEGSVRKAADQLRITVQLIDVASQVHLWSADYDRELKDVFAIQRDVAQQVAEALQVELLAGEEDQLAKQGTENLAAYNLYMKGLYFSKKHSKEGLEKSLEYFEQAIATDPTYAQAYARIALSYQLLGEMGMLPQKEMYPLAGAAARKALELDDTNIEAYLAAAVVGMYTDRDWQGAEHAFKRALQLAPNNAEVLDLYSALYLLPMGQYEEAVTMSKRAVELDPLSVLYQNDLGWVLWFAGQYDAALVHFQAVLEMEPDAPHAHLGFGMSYTLKGMYAQAIAAMQKRVDLIGSNALGHLGWAYGMAGERDEARKVLERIHERAQHEPIDPVGIAWLYMSLGEKDHAIEWLYKAYEEGNSHLLMYLKHPTYNSINSDPRFTELVQKIGLPTD